MKQRLIKEIKKKIRKKHIIFFFGLILISSFISAAVIGEDLHLNIQTTDATGAVVTGTFAFVFNISNSSDCNVSNVGYNKSITLTTDSRGIISYYLPNVTLDYDVQYWLCYYRDGTLINSSKMARSPYTFRARNITLSGVEVDENLDMGSYNVTADNADFGGGWLSDGVSIIGGNIYAQVGYFYNITSLNVTRQNLTILEDLNIDGNVTLGKKITFAFGEIIDNIVDGWVRITGNLNVTGNANFGQNITLKGTNDAVFWNNGTHLIID